VVKLDLDTVVLPNGHQTDLEIVRHPGAAAVVPVLDPAGGGEPEVVLVRQYRHASSGYLLEIPAGKLDPGEAPEHCAKRELCEEVGFEADTLVPMGVIWTTPGFSNERIWLYAARGLRPATQHLEADEVITVMRLPLAEAIRRAGCGLIDDAKSAIALLRVRYFL
jgi:ADP-ribose pyrophosphatase